MAYRFEVEESFAEGVRRIGCEQIDLAIANLGDTGDPHRGIHQARKSLKRIRALLRLVRPALRDGDYRRENLGFRDIARRLSKARDSQAVLEAIAKIDADASTRAAARRVSEWTHKQRGRALQRLDAGPREVLLDALRDARRRMGQMRVQGGLGRVCRGLELNYRQGRKALSRAYETQQETDFHELRKQVQRHWRHVQLLEASWPDAMRARAELARELSQLLGDDQDLSLLIARLKAKDGPFVDDPQLRALLLACDARRHALRAAARPRLERLFMERPRAFARRMEACWRTARAIAHAPVPEPVAGKLSAASGPGREDPLLPQQATPESR